jgi:hypothetical protein
VGQRRVTRDEHRLGRDGERDVERVAQRVPIAQRPRCPEERRRNSHDRRVGEVVERILDGVRRDVSRSLQAAERGEDLGVQLGRSERGPGGSTSDLSET